MSHNSTIIIDNNNRFQLFFRIFEIVRLNMDIMELLLNIPKYEESVNDDGLSEVEKKEIVDSIPIEGDKYATVVNIGPGADLMTILAVISAVANVFLVGDKIIKGVDGWLKIGKYIKSLFVRKELVSVDKDGASLLAIEWISTNGTINSLVKIDETTINLVDVSQMITEKSSLASKPHNYYIQTYLVNDDKYYVVGIKSSGDVNLIKCFEYGYSYGIHECNHRL